MLTQEQIKNLKPGDKLVHEIRFIKGGGDYIECSFSPLFSRDKTTFLIDRSLLSLPSEIVNSQSSIVNKHDPCRKFKKGDEVRVVAWNGRDIARIGQIGRVVSDEHNSRVELAIDGWTSSVYYPACHLELVTPVEELEPYTVDECGFAPTFYVSKNGKVYMTIPYKDGSSLFQTREEALAAAEAERDRLNAEYRKEQDHDK